MRCYPYVIVYVSKVNMKRRASEPSGAFALGENLCQGNQINRAATLAVRTLYLRDSRSAVST